VEQKEVDTSGHVFDHADFTTTLVTVPVSV